MPQKYFGMSTNFKDRPSHVVPMLISKTLSLIIYYPRDWFHSKLCYFLLVGFFLEANKAYLN